MIEPAIFSLDRTYRYALARDLGTLEGRGLVSFIGLNPSTADETVDDPTVRRCTGFARSWGAAVMAMVNLYAFRATDPAVMLAADDPVGPENDEYLRTVIGESRVVVCAWGALARADRAAHVLSMVPVPMCLGTTASGAPRHPLYVRGDTLPVRYG